MRTCAKPSSRCSTEPRNVAAQTRQRRILGVALKYRSAKGFGDIVPCEDRDGGCAIESLLHGLPVADVGSRKQQVVTLNSLRR